MPLLTIFVKRSILDVCQGSQCATGTYDPLYFNNFQPAEQ